MTMRRTLAALATGIILGLISLSSAAQTTSTQVPWANLERMGSVGAISGVASTHIGANRIATAVRDGAGKLKVIVWQLSYDGSITRLSAEQGEALPQSRLGTKLTIATLQRIPKTDFRRSRFVTAIRLDNGRLRVSVWTVREDGSIVRRGSRDTREAIKDAPLALATFRHDYVVTAAHDLAGFLRLKSWRVKDDGTLEQLKTVTGEATEEIALATYESFPLDSGRLATVATSPVDQDQFLVTRERGRHRTQSDSLQAASGTGVVASALSHRRIVTASRDIDEHLVVRSWDFDADGKFSMHSIAKGGKVSAIDVVTRNAAHIITSVRDADDNLAMITWMASTTFCA